ncbi:VOC family protein [Kribbella sp. NBC_00709]|uniref:bleomycin resistance protein n=1 Tax=Kribbella sp. NBC_00709 TaxID=2975972 RepID=UPI002E2A030A|nr:VOC family protein [Kribbella sp. NBC_00709]
MSSSTEPSLVPELLVVDVTRSIEFWCGLCGFVVEYQREEEGFAYVVRGSAHVMLEQLGIGRNWVTAPLERPLGRGINFQITVPELEPILSALGKADYPLFLPPETKWYQVSAHEETGVRQFLVTDPDGYLVRFQTSLGRRPRDERGGGGFRFGGGWLD